jgi:hypothetical protein
MTGLTRADLAADHWIHRYEIGYRLFVLAGREWIYWRKVSQRKFLQCLYDVAIASRSHPDDVLAMFHAGYVQHSGRRTFRALRA